MRAIDDCPTCGEPVERLTLEREYLAWPCGHAVDEVTVHSDRIDLWRNRPAEH